jgi:5,10-methylenetetrahydrofolate reductase
MPGIFVPEPLIEEIGNAPDRVKASIGICARLIHELRGLCQGIHLIPVGWEKRVPAILDAAKL